jgi:hypothetical protein
MYRMDKLGLAESDRVKFATIAEAQAMHIATDGYRLLREKLAEHGDELSAAELNMVWGTATDKLVKLQQIGAREHDGMALDNILGKLGAALSGKRLGLTIEDLPPDHQVIDVTPS